MIPYVITRKITTAFHICIDTDIPSFKLETIRVLARMVYDSAHASHSSYALHTDEQILTELKAIDVHYFLADSWLTLAMAELAEPVCRACEFYTILSHLSRIDLAFLEQALHDNSGIQGNQVVYNAYSARVLVANPLAYILAEQTILK